jgi:dTDP-4-dehydrorhamnose reductase
VVQRWLVTGCCGQLGGHVTAALARRGSAVVGIGHHGCPGGHGPVVPVDLARWHDLDAVLRRFRPSHVVHLAGVSSPAEVAAAPGAGWALNVGLTRRIADVVRATGAWMLYPSSDFVWDGAAGRRYRETDPPCRRTAYACTKLDAERAVLDARAGAVVRFSLLYGLPCCPRDTTWSRMDAALRAGAELPVYADEYRTPLSLTDAARVVVALGDRDHHGLLHVAGPEVLTPREMATRLAGTLGVRPRLRVVARRDFGGALPRPRNMAMDSSRLAALHPALLPSAMPSSAPFGVVIPVHHGSLVLARSMESLARQRFDGELLVAVAVNDGRAASRHAAERLAPMLRAAGIGCTVLVTAPGRVTAIEAAEAVLPAGPRLYLDQDAALSSHAIAALAAALAPGGAHFAAPAPRVAPGPSAASRAYYRAWQDLPYVRDSPATMGAYAVSAAGRARWDRFAPVRSDDKWVRWHFAPHERTVVADAWYEVLAPQGVRELVRARRRYRRGNAELSALPPVAGVPVSQVGGPRYGDDGVRHRGALRSLAASPLRSAVFVGVHAVAAVLDRGER